MAELVYTRPYERSAADVLSEDERRVAEDEIAGDPTAWPVIPTSGGMRKARAARGGKGKSGGARVIYYYVAADDRVFLLFAYAKSEQKNLAPKEMKRLKALVAGLIGGRDG